MSHQIDRSKKPVAGNPRPFNFPAFEKRKLSNGLKIITAQKSNLPLINILLHINISPLDDPRNAEGELNLFSQLLLEGSKTFNSEQIATQFEHIGAEYNTHLSWNGFFFELNVLKEHLIAGFSLFSDLILNSIFPDKEFDRLKNETLVGRLQILDMPSRLASEHLFRQLFPDHRYGLPIEGIETSIPNIRLRRIFQFYRENFPMRSATLIFTGDISPKESYAISKNYFEEWTPKIIRTEVSDDFFPSLNSPIVLVEKPDAAQTEVRVGQFIPERNHPDFFKIKLMNEIFGGYFLSRLNLNLRERNGFTYSIHSNLIYRPAIGVMSISASVQNEFVTKGLKEIFNEIKRLQNETISDEELQNAQGYLTGVFPTAFETINQISDALATLITFDLPDDYYRSFRDHLNQITKKDILKAAQGYLATDEMQVVLVGDKSKILPELEKEFDVQVVDPKGNNTE